MAVPDELLAILRCIECRGELDDRGDRLVCRDCATGYPVEGDIPIMLAERMIPPEGDRK